MVAVIDKERAEWAALALPANMNLEDMMTEIDLTKNRNRSEPQKKASIKKLT